MRRFMGGSRSCSKRSNVFTRLMNGAAFFRRSTTPAAPACKSARPTRQFGYAFRSAASTIASHPAGQHTASQAHGIGACACERAGQE